MWKEFFTTNLLDEKLQIGYYNYNYKEAGRPKVTRQYFVCKGQPKYNSPLNQLKAVKKGQFAYINLQNNHQLRWRITHHSYVLQNTPVLQQYRRGHWQGSTPSPKKSNKIRTVIDDKSEELIEYALQLDFGCQPRMNHNGTKEIQLNGRKQANEDGRWRVLTTAMHWGRTYPFGESQQINLGYQKISESTILRWLGY